MIPILIPSFWIRNKSSGLVIKHLPSRTHVNAHPIHFVLIASNAAVGTMTSTSSKARWITALVGVGSVGVETLGTRFGTHRTVNWKARFIRTLPQSRTFLTILFRCSPAQPIAVLVTVNCFGTLLMRVQSAHGLLALVVQYFVPVYRVGEVTHSRIVLNGHTSVADH